MLAPRSTRPIVLALATLLAVLEATPAVAGPRLDAADRLLPPASPGPRGTAGASYTSLVTRPFEVEGSPYRWVVEATQYRPGPGLPPDDPHLRVIASRRAPSGTRPYQAHQWEFDLAAGSFQFDGELRHVSLDTGLIPGYGAFFEDLEELSALKTTKRRCPKTGDVLASESRRTGVLRGSMTFLPGYDDPQMPDEVAIGHVRATIWRTKYTGNDCHYAATCDPGRTESGVELVGGGGYLVNAGESPAFDGIGFYQVETVGVAQVVHQILAFGDADVLATSSTTVAVMSDVGVPFIAPGGVMSWTKGAKTVKLTRRCRRTTWVLEAPAGSFDLRLDSGDQTIAAPSDAEFEVVVRR